MSQMRTITYTVKVDTSDGKKAARDMRVTMRTMEQDSGKAEASMQKLGNALGKQLGTNVKIVKDETKTLSSSLRQSFADAKKAEKNFNMLSNEYKLLTARVGRTADQQEQLNAIYRLGSEATLTQKKRTLELVKAYQLQRNAGNKVQGSFRGMRGQMQNFGYQMQDVAVQMQMGTNAMTIFSQQGSQLAAGFGPTGAIIGAGIAFAGMMGSLLIPNLFKGGEEVKKLTERLQELAKSTGLTKEQAAVVIAAEEEKIKAYKKEAKELSEKLNSVSMVTQTYKEYEKQQKAYVVALASSNSKVIATVQTEKQWNKQQQENTLAQNQTIARLQELQVETGKANRAKRLANASVGQGTSDLKTWYNSNKNITESLADQVEQLGLSNSQLLELKKSQTLKTLADQKAGDEARRTAAADYDALIVAARRTEMEQELSKELAERSKQEADARSKQNEALAAEKKLLNLRATLTDSGKLDQLRSQYEEEKLLLAGHKDELIALEQRYERDRLQISGTAWEQYVANLQEAAMDFEKMSADMLEGSIENLSNGIANAIVNSENLGDAFKNTFSAIAEAGIASLVQMGIQRTIFSNLDAGLKAKETTVHVASEATKSEATLAAKVLEMQALKAVYTLNVYARGMAETTLGALNAAASTAAIPIVGPALAAGSAAAFTSFGVGLTSTAVGFAGAYDKGGVIPQGMTGIVSEYGDELVDGMLVKGKQGGTRVTGREDTARIVNNNNGGTNNITINSSGNVSGEAIARALSRVLKKPNKRLDTMVYDSTNRGRNNRGGRIA